jgi:hypothetical protein
LRATTKEEHSPGGSEHVKRTVLGLSRGER